MVSLYRSEVSAGIISSPTMMVMMMMMSACALPLQQFLYLCVAITGRGRTGVHSADGSVASLEIVTGGAVLRQTVQGPIAVIQVFSQEQTAATAQCGVHSRYRHLEHKSNCKGTYIILNNYSSKHGIVKS
jgi:hypothetical protein